MQNKKSRKPSDTSAMRLASHHNFGSNLLYFPGRYRLPSGECTQNMTCKATQGETTPPGRSQSWQPSPLRFASPACRCFRVHNTRGTLNLGPCSVPGCLCTESTIVLCPIRIPPRC